MSGYREHSFDPNAYEQPGRPLKPYNWVQWTGVAIGVLGLAIIALGLLGRFGWIPPWLDGPPGVSFMLPIIGISLINSRREPGTQVGSEQLEKNRRILFITTGVLALILGVIAVIEFSGA